MWLRMCIIIFTFKPNIIWFLLRFRIWDITKAHILYLPKILIFLWPTWLMILLIMLSCFRNINIKEAYNIRMKGEKASPSTHFDCKFNKEKKKSKPKASHILKINISRWVTWVPTDFVFPIFWLLPSFRFPAGNESSLLILIKKHGLWPFTLEIYWSN